MFLRATKTHSKAGRPASSVRLVQSERHGSSVRQKTLLNLGTAYPVPEPLWRQVAATASDIFHGQPSLFSVDPEVLSAAEHLVHRLRERGFQTRTDADSRFATVDLDTLQHDATRSVGAERLCLQALDELGFQRLLLRQGASQRDSKIATALIVARMLHPSSEREALRWMQRSSALLEVLGLDAGLGPSRSKLYRTNDLLWKHREALQDGLFQRERTLLRLSGTIVFYDLSNVHYSGRENDTLRRFGRSKQKRNDCPLVTLALALDGEGFPRRCELLPGNASEPGTLQGVLEKLAQQEGSGAGPRPTVVMDAGIASQANIEWLRAHGWEWIAVSREAKPKPPKGEPEALVRTQAGYDVRVWPVQREQGVQADRQAAGEERDGQGRELRLYAVSEARQRREQEILQKQRKRYEEALEHLHAGLSEPRRLKNLEKVQRKVGKLEQRHNRVASHYEVTVRPQLDKRGRPATGKQAKAAAVEYKQKPKHAAVDAGAGGYMLRTSHADWDVERVLRTYWTLTAVEATFRELKSSLGLRPLYHRLNARVSAHMLISVLAYHAVHLIRTRLREQGIRLSWQSIREELRDWTRVTTTVRATDGAQITNRQDVRPTPEAARIARAAGLQPRLYRRRMRAGKLERSQNVVPSGAEAQDGQPPLE